MVGPGVGLPGQACFLEKVGSGLAWHGRGWGSPRASDPPTTHPLTSGGLSVPEAKSDSEPARRRARLRPGRFLLGPLLSPGAGGGGGPGASPQVLSNLVLPGAGFDSQVCVWEGMVSAGVWGSVILFNK